jgi:TIR domain
MKPRAWSATARWCRGLSLFGLLVSLGCFAYESYTTYFEWTSSLPDHRAGPLPVYLATLLVHLIGSAGWVYLLVRLRVLATRRTEFVKAEHLRLSAILMVLCLPFQGIVTLNSGPMAWVFHLVCVALAAVLFWGVLLRWVIRLRHDFVLTYNSQDRALAQKLATWIRSHGYSVWMDIGDERAEDTLEIRGGEDWWERIQDELLHSRAIIIFLGPHGFGRIQTFELGLAWVERRERGAILVPFFADQQSMAAALAPGEDFDLPVTHAKMGIPEFLAPLSAPDAAALLRCLPGPMQPRG